MYRLKTLQYSLICSLLAACAVIICVPFRIVPSLYAALFVFLVLIPYAALIAYNVHVMRHSLIEFRRAVYDWRLSHLSRHEKCRSLPTRSIFVLCTAAMQKSSGINPDRAGPSAVCA